MTLRNLPSVDRLLLNGHSQVTAFGRPLVLRAYRTVLDQIRQQVANGLLETPSQETIFERAGFLLSNWSSASLYPVINATGVILHTNLGRAPLSAATVRAMAEISIGYSNLEFDIPSGKRGSRGIHAESILKNLLGVEAALVVNNCASAVLLALSALANRRTVVIPRSQLVEIGGGFRIPDVMRQSGAKLAEIGTTNKLRLGDFEEAIKVLPEKSLVMRAHQSNFKIIGFTEEPALNDIVRLVHQYNLVFLDDLGSGALLDTARYGIEHEPTVQESLAAGSDLVLFSGDKLMGGPQAGIMVGRKDLIDKIKRHPLARAVRADKVCLAGVTATLLHYLKDEAEEVIPIWKMVATPLDSIKARAEAWQRVMEGGQVMPGQSTIGGGSLPGENFATWVLAIPVLSPDKTLNRLRKLTPPVIARIQDDKVLLDPRTVLPEQDPFIMKSLSQLFPKYTK